MMISEHIVDNIFKQAWPVFFKCFHLFLSNTNNSINYLSFVYTVKYFQVLLFNTNNSIKH